jgi:hypothetical protein
MVPWGKCYILFDNYIKNQIKGGFQLEFVSISRVINHMACYKFECSNWWTIFFKKNPLQDFRFLLITNPFILLDNTEEDGQKISFLKSAKNVFFTVF